MNRYLKMVIEQYKRATGTKNIDVNSAAFFSELKQWLNRNAAIGKKYKRYLERFEITPEIGEKTAEVGKGALDSIALDNDIIMITPYRYGLEDSEKEIIFSELAVVENNPVVYPGCMGESVITPDIFNRFITQNPYDYTALVNWEYLPNEDRAISVGAYGAVYDKDYDKKIEFLKTFRDKLTVDYLEKLFTVGDSYFYIISTGKEINEFSKVLTRKRDFSEEEVEKKEDKDEDEYIECPRRR